MEFTFKDSLSDIFVMLIKDPLRRGCFLNRYDFFYFRNFLLEHPLNTLLEGYCGTRSAAASTLQPHFNQSVGIDSYKLNISAVSLEKRPYFIDYFLNFFLHFTTSLLI